MAEPAPIAACPACNVAPLAEQLAGGQALTTSNIVLSLPGIHCAGCISAVERTLSAVDGVKDARVNLTLKRAHVETGPDVDIPVLIDALAGAGYEAYELDAAMLDATRTDTRSRALLTRLAVAGFAMMNVMLLSVAIWSGATDVTRDMFHWISGAIALPAVAYAAQPFFVNAWAALRVARLNMDVPISLAIILASGLSVFETMQGGENAYFDAALSLTFFLLAGRYLDHRTRSVARSAAQELSALEVPRALLASGETVALADVPVGAVVRVLPGMRVPVDGEIVDGESELDRSLLTGETIPSFAECGVQVSAGELNLTGALLVRVTAAGEDSNLRRMVDLVAVAESARNRYTSLADRAARIYAPVVHILAFVAFAGWYWASGDARLAMNIAVAVLIITCPCALGLAVPAVTTAASGRLFKNGILIKNATALERLAEVDTVVFDKTGTLTRGTPELIDTDTGDPRLFAVALGLAQGSAHPLSVALCKAAGAANAAELSERLEVPGHGVQALWQGQVVRLGRADWVGASAGQGTQSWLRIGDEPPHAFHFSDQLREGAEAAVHALKAQGLDVVLLSGDTPSAVADIAKRVGIEAWDAAMLPEDKAVRIVALTRSGRRVLMFGDGLNDTAALAGAHVSVSPASALDAARVVSDMVLLGDTLLAIPDAVQVAGLATRRIKENFAIAALYNAVAIPVALMGYATPLVAALAMSSSSISVSLNALRLTRK